MQSFGIMQGRLTQPKGRGIQFFPFEFWEEEFRIAKSLGLNEIEWILDYDQYEQNPFWTHEGVERVRKICMETGVMIRSVCFDYFMRRPFFKQTEAERDAFRKENMHFIETTAEAMSKVGATLLEIPLVDASSVKTEEEKELVRDFAREVIVFARNRQVRVSLETDFPPVAFREFLESVEDEVYANYDSGNSSGLGYDHEQEILSLGEYIANVHIKDRKLHGTTVALGTGSADFDKVFSSLKKINYRESIILQAARGDEGVETDAVRSQMDFVTRCCDRFGL